MLKHIRLNNLYIDNLKSDLSSNENLIKDQNSIGYLVNNVGSIFCFNFKLFLNQNSNNEEVLGAPTASRYLVKNVQL